MPRPADAFPSCESLPNGRRRAAPDFARYICEKSGEPAWRPTNLLELGSLAAESPSVSLRLYECSRHRVAVEGARRPCRLEPERSSRTAATGKRARPLRSRVRPMNQIPAVACYEAATVRGRETHR